MFLLRDRERPVFITSLFFQTPLPFHPQASAFHLSLAFDNVTTVMNINERSKTVMNGLLLRYFKTQLNDLER